MNKHLFEHKGLMIKGAAVLAGILILNIRNIDFATGNILIYGEAKNFQDAVSLWSIVLWTVLVSLFFGSRDRMQVFVLLSIYFAIDHPIWYYLHIVSDRQSISMADSVTYFQKAYEYGMGEMDFARGMFHAAAALVSGVVFVVISAVVWVVRVVLMVVVKSVSEFLIKRRK